MKRVRTPSRRRLIRREWACFTVRRFTMGSGVGSEIRVGVLRDPCGQTIHSVSIADREFRFQYKGSSRWSDCDTNGAEARLTTMSFPVPRCLTPQRRPDSRCPDTCPLRRRVGFRRTEPLGLVSHPTSRASDSIRTGVLRHRIGGGLLRLLDVIEHP